MAWLLRSPEPDPRGRPQYLVRVAHGRIATSDQQATAAQFPAAEDALAFQRANPEATGWVLVRAT